jgi:hypothetical protein
MPFRTTAMFDAWFQASSAVVDRVDPSVTVTPALLAGYDVVMLQVVNRNYAPDEATALRDHVAAGHGLFVLTGYDGGASELGWFNTLVGPLGITAQTATFTDVSITTFTPHPITAGVTNIFWSGGFLVNLPATATPLADYMGLVVSGAFELGSGRVVVWGDDWILFDTVWNANNAAFWQHALAWVWPTP